MFALLVFIGVVFETCLRPRAAEPAQPKAEQPARAQRPPWRLEVLVVLFELSTKCAVQDS